MASFVKAKLKSAREALNKKEFSRAREHAEEVLTYEADNYNANVFLGLALMELGEQDASEQAYQRAIQSSPEQMLAWQGIMKFYDKTQKWDKYVETLRKMMDIYSQSDDAVRCAEILQKYIEFRRQREVRTEIIDALLLLLPGSPLYPTLSSLPPPDPTAPTASTVLSIQTSIQNSLPTLEEVVALMEREEEETIERELRRRRTRLDFAGASVESLRKSVGFQIWSNSKIPELYSEIINHVHTSDELRRGTEAKLLQYKHRYLCAIPVDRDNAKLKMEIRQEVQNLVEGIVLLNIPNELAWELMLEGQDVDSGEDFDYELLRRFMKLFPNAPLAHAIQGYFLYNNKTSLLGRKDGDDEDEELEENTALVNDRDPFDILLDAVANLPDSLTAHRMLCDVYISEEDYASVISAADKGLQLISQYLSNTGKELAQVRKGFSATLATGLVHLHPPKHHTRAIHILNEVLAIEPGNAICLMGRAYIMQAAQKWSSAAELFEKVAVQLPNDVNTGLVAREEHAWCLVEAGELGTATEELRHVLDRVDRLEGYTERKARVWWRLGTSYWRTGDQAREESYRHFITALKRSASFAPAFTSLGLYYLEFSSPPDPKRAIKCFQKAFELDAREVEAARRLASSFADEREWDLVEVVARRTIEGEGGFNGGLDGSEQAAAARHKPSNAWAWKALGLVELNRRGYPAAIQAFQVALRSDEQDALSWLSLGEAYVNAGKHAAALKALNRSYELEPGNWLCLYQIGEVQRQTGLLPQAITTFSDLLKTRPDEAALLHAIGQTYVELGRSELATGFLERSTESFLAAITKSLHFLSSSPGFRRLALKTIIDSLLALSDFSSFTNEHLARKILSRVEILVSDKRDEKLIEIVSYPLLETAPIEHIHLLRLAAVTCSHRLALFAKDEEGIGSAWYDLGITLQRISTTTRSDPAKEKAEKQALESLRLALISDSLNPIFWTAFGNSNFLTKPMVAQHAYIRSLELNSKDAAVWTNLALLYLHNQDLDLASQALLKAQTLDPDYTLAWVGQGLVAVSYGREDDASALFEHVISLTADMPEGDLEFAYRMFNKMPRMATRSTKATRESLLMPFFVLDRYCRRRPQDFSAFHLFGLICERLHLEDLGVKMLSRAIEKLEAVYEETEDIAIERRYAIANANLGRLLLATSTFEKALETFETAFSLLPTEDDEFESVSLRAMCQFGSGIAQFHLGRLEEALVSFETAQEIAKSYSVVRGHITVLLAQTLWAIGGDECRESAKEQLLNCINDDPENLAAVIALAAMGLLTDDEALIDAALSEILSLPLEERHKRDPERNVETLLANHYLAEGNVTDAIGVIQHSVFADPSRLETRQELASMALAQGRPRVALALVSSVLDSPDLYREDGLYSSLRIMAIALVDIGSDEAMENEALKTAQKAVALAPWDSRNWLALAYVRNMQKGD